MSVVFLFEMGWKSALIAGAALMLVALMRSRAPAERADLLRLTMMLLLLLPGVAMFAPSVALQTPLPATALAGAGVSDVSVVAPVDFTQAFVAAYAVGVTLVLARLLVGLGALQRWVSGAAPITDPRWRAALTAMPMRKVRVLASDCIRAPVSFGWLRPVILIDRATLQKPEHARAVLAHEAAHLARQDWLALMGFHAAAALFWFNPFVWIAKRVAEQLAEEAADQRALAINEPTAYAQALLDCAQSPTTSVAVGMSNGRILRRRMRLILSHTGGSNKGRFAPLPVVATVAFATSVAIVSFVAPSSAFAPTSKIARPVSTSVPSVEPRGTPAPTPDQTSGQVINSELVTDLDVLAELPAHGLIQIADQASTQLETESATNARREGWEENARRNQARNQRRAEERERRDRANQNRAWLATRTISN